jgi:hypothetical protein
MTISGGGLCGGVQYEIPGELRDLAFCHCSICRRTLGAAFGAYARMGTACFQQAMSQYPEPISCL